MTHDFIVEMGDDGEKWVCSLSTGTAIAILSVKEGRLFDTMAT